MGFRVRGVRAAWGSCHRDTGIAKYAKWANEQIDTYGNPAWLKPILLALYGALASKPRYAESVFRLAKRGEPVTIITGHNQLEGVHVKSSHELEPHIANVIHRGMIEAATRSESVGLAQHLTLLGQRILHIYADAVIVEVNEDNPLPELPEPWRLKRTLTHWEPINEQSYKSDQESKLPGVTRDEAILHRQRVPGVAPRPPMYNSLSNQRVKSTRRI